MIKISYTMSGLAAAGLLISCAFAQESRPWRTVLEPLGAPGGEGGSAGLGQISVESDRLGRITVFGLEAGGSRVAYRQQISPNGGWPDWQKMPRTDVPFRFIAAASNEDRRLEVFALGDDYQFYHSYQLKEGAHPWSDWVKMSGPGFPQDAPIVVGKNKDGRLEVFALTTDCGVSHAYQQVPNGDFTAFICLGPLPAPVKPRTLRVILSGSSLHLFGLGYNNRVYETYQSRGAPNFDWVDWSPLPPLVPSSFIPDEKFVSISVGANGDGRLQVFARGTGHYYTNFQLSGPSSVERDWQPFWQNISAGPPIPQVAYSDAAVDPVAVYPNTVLDLFTYGTDGVFYHLVGNKPAPFFPAGGGFLKLGTLPGPLKAGDSRAAVRNADGRLEFFVLTQDGQLYHTYQP